mgnify:CR=1 FL=1
MPTGARMSGYAKKSSKPTGSKKKKKGGKK